MSAVQPVSGKRGQAIPHEHIPAVGSWCWVKDPDDEKDKPLLMCVWHIGSNHVEFKRPHCRLDSNNNVDSNSGWTFRVHFKHLLSHVRHEPEAEAIFAKELADLETQYRERLHELVDLARNANLINERSAEPTLLPSVVRLDPAAEKAKLLLAK